MLIAFHKSPNKLRISCIEEHVKDIDGPHDDALVISLPVGGFKLQRVLVNGGATINIIFLDALLQMRLTEDNIKGHPIPLVGFKGSVFRSLDKIDLLVNIYPLCHMIEFHVIHSASPYNVIMGRPWIHKIKGVPSTYHQRRPKGG